MGKDIGYSQKELSELFGWSPAWIRRVELLGLLPGLESEPRRGRKGRSYSKADLGRILWVSLMRHAGIEFSEIKDYVEKAKSLVDLLKKYETLKDGEELRPVFFHTPDTDVTPVYINPDRIRADDVAAINRLSMDLSEKADELTRRVQRWRNEMAPIFDQMGFLEKQATRSKDSMTDINLKCIPNRLLAIRKK